MASIDRRQGFERTRTFSQRGARAPRWMVPLIAMAWSCLPPSPDIQCVASENCNLLAGGVCRSAPSGSRWCSYPDSACPSGHRFSDLDVGDGLSGACTETPGQPRWALQLGGIGWDYGGGITTDGEGNVIAVGTFSDSLSIGDVTLTSAGDKDLFVVKLDGYSGEVRWLKRFGDLDFEAGSAIRIDAANNIYVMGIFLESVDLGGGELRSAGNEDMFVLKLSTDGEHVWSRQLGSAEQEGGYDLAVRDGAIAVVGSRSQPFTLDGAALLHLGYLYTDVFIAMLTTDGEPLWSKSVGGPRWDYAFGAAIDSRGDLVVVGDFTDTVNFGGLPLTSASGDSDVFVVKYAGTSGGHLFSRKHGGPEAEKGLAVTIDPMDHIIVGGLFSGTADFGGSNPLRAIGSSNIFVAKYTLAGAHLWARSFHATSASGPGQLQPRSMTVHDTADIVLAGQFCGAISFGGSEISSAGQCSSSATDAFAVRIAGTDGTHVSSVRAASRAEMARTAVAADGRLYLVGAFSQYAEIGGHVMTPVSSTDAFVLALAPL